MLTKILEQSDEVRLVLTVDESVLAAQVLAARALVEKELGSREGSEFVDGIIAASRAAAGEHSEFVGLLLELRSIGSMLLGKVLTDDEKTKAIESLEATLADEDVRQSLAYVRAQACLAQYRESANVADLLDSDPSGATWITVRPVPRHELRKIERAAGPRPRLGALHHSHAADRARRASRQGADGVEAFASYLAGISTEEQAAVELFEDWQIRLDREVFAVAVQAVDGFDLKRGASGYPVGEFVQACPEAHDVIGEIARSALQVGRLGKSGRPRSSSRPGTVAQDEERHQSRTDGTVGNVPSEGGQQKTA